MTYTKITYIPNRIIDANGIVDGGSIYVYQSGGTTTVSLFSDAALSIPVSNPYVVAAGGAVPPLYTSYALPIRLKIVTTAGVVQDDDPYLSVAGTVEQVIAGRAPITPQMFGTIAAGIDASPAINAALAYLNTLKTTAIYGYSNGSPKLFIPAMPFPYRIGSDINVYNSLEIEWENGAGPSGGCAVWKLDAGVTGIRTHSNTSTGRNGETTNRGYSATGTVLRNPFIIGGFTSSEGESYGIQMRVKTFIYDPYIEGCEGDGIFADTSGVDNVNGSVIWNPFITGCRNGIYLNYNNANAIQIFNPQMFANRLCGILSINGYGCSIYGGNSANNGTVIGFPTQSFNNGHVYGVLPGQETWCSTNTPPSTAVNNTGWFYLYDAGAATASVPQWVTAQTWRSAAPIRIDGGSTAGSIVGHEVESSQMPIECINGSKILVHGGLQGSGVPIGQTGLPHGGYISGDGSGLYARAYFPQVDRSGSLGGPSQRFDISYVYDLNAKNSVGFGTGVGAAVTQLTSKSTATPAINTPCGSITMNNAALAAGAKVSFVVSNNMILARDIPLICVASGGTANAYRASCTAVAAGTSFTITVENITAGSLSEAPVITFALFRAQNS